MDEKRREFLKAALPLARTQGWGKLDLPAIAKTADLDPEVLSFYFPRGVLDLVLFHLGEGDRALALPASLEQGKVREKIASLIEQRLTYEDRELAQKTTRFLALPLNSSASMKALWQTADRIWQAAGLNDSGFSYYTKRITLAGIYGQAVLFYLSPQGKEEGALKKFIERQIALLLKTFSLFNLGQSPQAKA